VSDDLVPLLRAYVEARNRSDVSALPQLVTEDVEIGTFGKGIELREHWNDTYNHLDEVMLVERAETEGDAVTASLRIELRWRESGELAASCSARTRYLFRDKLIARTESLGMSPWERA
jgi:hypothetical protein